MAETDRVRRPMRAVVLCAFAAVLAALVLAIGGALAVLADNARLEQARECRARIVAHAEGIRDARDSALADGLASSVIAREQIDPRARAQQIRDLGQALEAAADLRRQADGICAGNPDFVPPP